MKIVWQMGPFWAKSHDYIGGNMQITIQEFIKILQKVKTVSRAELLLLYDSKFTLTFGDYSVDIPFDASAYNHLVSALIGILKETV